MPPPVFVINLERSPDRRSGIARALDAAGIPHQFVTAVDGDALGGDYAATMATVQPHLGRPLSRSEIGCLLSHLAVLDRIRDERLPLACVFEDDVQVAGDARAVLDAAAAWMSAGDLLLLGHHSARHSPLHGAETCYAQTRLAPGRNVSRVAEFALGAYAYVVGAQAAERLALHARPLRMPMDWITGYAPVAGARLFAVTPPCVTPDGAGAATSTINERDGGQPLGRRGDWLRDRAGRVWLAARKAGLFPDSYVRRF